MKTTNKKQSWLEGLIVIAVILLVLSIIIPSCDRVKNPDKYAVKTKDKVIGKEIRDNGYWLIYEVTYIDNHKGIKQYDVTQEEYYRAILVIEQPILERK